MTTLHEQLAAAFPVGELKFFPVALTKDKTKGRVGSYIDARAVMDRLDDVVGPESWQTTYRVLDEANKAVECQLTVRLNDVWVSKADVGYPNEAKDADNADKEPLKAAFSDALKRAAVQFGIGRYIYSLELAQDWLPVDQFGKFTEQPRLKGTPAPMPVRPPIQNMPAQKKPTFFEVAEQMGFSVDTVESESQRMFNNKDVAHLTVEEKKSLFLSLQERAKKEPVHA